MKTPRRRFLRLMGATGIVSVPVISGGACVEIPEAANSPWRSAQKGRNDARLNALAHAILAPSPHNRQPWIADVREPDRVRLYCDLDRRLPETDPFDRQILIGLGCFLETLSLAATVTGWRADIRLFPEGPPQGRLDTRCIAAVNFTQGAAPDPLAAQIVRRRSNKKVYDVQRPVAAELLDAIGQAARGPGVEVRMIGPGPLCEQLRELTWKGYEREMITPSKRMESVNLTRIGGAEIARHRDGISLGGAMMSLGRVLGMVSRESLADPTSMGFKKGMEITRDLMKSAMAHMILFTPVSDRIAQVNAGRAHVRANLKATELGVAMHPLSQLMQEYEEMADLKAEFEKAVELQAPLTAQMLSRLGYGPEVEPSPRRDVESVVV